MRIPSCFKKEAEPAFAHAKELIEEYRQQLRTPVSAPQPPPSSTADELERLPNSIGKAC